MRKDRDSGQVFLGIIISLGVLSILSGVVISLVLTAYKIVSFTQARTNAKHVATEHMEIIRNLPFDDVGTVGGLPAGVYPQTQTTQRNGLTYDITITIVYIDDPFDGESPDDLLASDYKRIRVDVAWGGLGQSGNNPVTLISDLAPRGVETTTGGGTLSILVFDSDGEPVPQANVHIVAASVNPPVNANYQTANNGRLILPGALACNSCYQITVSKNLFSTDRTYSSTEVANPIKPHQTLIAGELTQISFSIDNFSNLTVQTVGSREEGFTPLPSQQISLRGEKIIGNNALDEPVYKYKETLTTGANGLLEIPNLEWDSYQLAHTSSALDLAGANPLAPLVLLPGTSTLAKLSLVPHTVNSILAMFMDSTNNPIASVAATLRENTTTIASASSGLTEDPDFGQVFFSSLSSQIYTLEATASGFLNYSANINVSGQNIEPIILTPQ